MAAVAFEPGGEGRFRLAGDLTFGTVTAALQEGEQRFAGLKRLELDLSGVGTTDSAGLALLVEWAAQARRDRCKLSLKHMPKRALALAKISEVDKILPIG